MSSIETNTQFLSAVFFKISPTKLHKNMDDDNFFEDDDTFDGLGEAELAALEEEATQFTHARRGADVYQPYHEQQIQRPQWEEQQYAHADYRLGTVPTMPDPAIEGALSQEFENTHITTEAVVLAEYRQLEETGEGWEATLPYDQQQDVQAKDYNEANYGAVDFGGYYGGAEGGMQISSSAEEGGGQQNAQSVASAELMKFQARIEEVCSRRARKTSVMSNMHVHSA